VSRELFAHLIDEQIEQRAIINFLWHEGYIADNIQKKSRLVAGEIANATFIT
jgi:two-component SAPR family response regulator